MHAVFQLEMRSLKVLKSEKSLKVGCGFAKRLFGKIEPHYSGFVRNPESGGIGSSGNNDYEGK